MIINKTVKNFFIILPLLSSVKQLLPTWETQTEPSARLKNPAPAGFSWLLRNFLSTRGLRGKLSPEAAEPFLSRSYNLLSPSYLEGTLTSANSYG